jgi:two-component system response regulator FixJ
MVHRASRAVLVVEDDDAMRTALQRLLNVAGYPCVSYPTAEALLEGATVPNGLCVLCDLKLPGISGLELLTQLRQRGDGIPVIVMTAHDSPGVRHESVRLGAAAYLAKPFGRDELLVAIDTLADSTMR